ncbi:MAG: hypothetical protein IJ723_07905, partial [Ruminococcus sp.]|nr:hypothetical protein [Ruminococcus sp.]
RERALFEVDRFRHRADDLIFYVMPVGFEYIRLKLDWDELPEYDEEMFVPATKEEQIAEACKRLCFMTGQRVAPGTDPLERLRIRCPELILMFFKDEITQEYNLYPFAVANPDTVIYVSGNKADWEYERCDIGLKSKTYDGIVPAWVYSGRGYNLVSEFGEIGYKRRGYGLIRTA